MILSVKFCRTKQRKLVFKKKPIAAPKKIVPNMNEL